MVQQMLAFIRKRRLVTALARRTIALAALLILLLGCSPPATRPAPAPPTPPPTARPTLPPTAQPTLAPTQPSIEHRPEGFSDEQIATLASLVQADDYPLYTMRYYGDYEDLQSFLEDVDIQCLSHAQPTTPWACSLFAALGDSEHMLYGRNFDWEYSPAVLLFTDPPSGYASVSMVDIAYLGFAGSRAGELLDLPLAEREDLLYAPFLPFDGMNERGLAVGMAAVPDSATPYDANMETIDSLMVIRRMLDGAATVDEAVAIMRGYNIDWGGGPPIHYLIADCSGRAALVEFYQGETVVLPNEQPWHVGTNFLRSAAGESAEGYCWRYDEIGRQLSETGGRLSAQGATDLLNAVSQDGTQWSIVYGISSGEISVTMGRAYEHVHAFGWGLGYDAP